MARHKLLQTFLTNKVRSIICCGNLAALEVIREDLVLHWRPTKEIVSLVIWFLECWNLHCVPKSQALVPDTIWRLNEIITNECTRKGAWGDGGFLFAKTCEFLENCAPWTRRAYVIMRTDEAWRQYYPHLRTFWNSFRQEKAIAALAFCQGTHPRLGADSCVRWLPIELIEKIIKEI